MSVWDDIEDMIHEKQANLSHYMVHIGKALTGRVEDGLTLSEENMFPRWRVEGKGNVVIGGATFGKIMTGEGWHADVMIDLVTGALFVRIIGHEVDRAVEVLSEHAPDTEFGQAVLDAVTTEHERLSAPYARTPVPGKKKAKSRAHSDQLEMGDGVPVFGKPETGRKAKKQ